MSNGNRQSNDVSVLVLIAVLTIAWAQCDALTRIEKKLGTHPDQTKGQVSSR